ncbi:MAG: CBS domain-containing protein [Saprospiraceae bacterium]|jgi:CBS domain-containing protein
MNNNLNIAISEIMSTSLKTLHPKDKIQSAKDLFDEFDIHHIPVAVMGEVRGIISQGDLLFLEGVASHSFDKFLRKKKYEMSTVDEIMTANPYCIELETKVSEVMDIMIENRINCLLIKKNNELVGMITNFDLIKYFRTKINTN